MYEYLFLTVYDMSYRKNTVINMDITYYLLIVFIFFGNLMGIGCVDPCLNYTLVEDSTRLTSYTRDTNETALCDDFIPKWYRFNASITGAMATECPDKLHCGSDMQIWINDTLPTEADGIVHKQVCVKIDSDCCGMERRISVKNCTTFFVYILVPSPVQCVSYCVQDIDECLSSPCQNGATCHDGLNEYNCSCLDGWTGDNCVQDIDECVSSPCQNGATCDNQLNSYTCTCAGGWSGTNCAYDIDECRSSPCRNRATCQNDLDSFACICAGGWTGTNCEYDIDECVSSPCQNGATCDNQLNSYACTCAGGWSGTNCEYDIDECSINPCQNGATCIDGNNKYSCNCSNGWSGVNCEKGAKLDTSSQSCANFTNVSSCGNGTHCELENGIPSCKQNIQPQAETSMAKMKIIVPVSISGVFVFVVIIGTTIYCVRARRRMRSRRLEQRVDIHLQEVKPGIGKSDKFKGIAN